MELTNSDTKIFRVQTYNLAVFSSHKNWDLRKHLIAEEIKKSNPDVVGFQEIRFDPDYKSNIFTKVYNKLTKSQPSNPKHMLSDVLDHLSGYQYSYFCETNKYFDNSIEGIGVISKHPILENNALRLSKFKDDRDYRYCLESLIEIKNTRVLFYNTHLTFGKLGQRRQAQEVIDFMKIKEKPQILLGDMNIEKSSNDDIYSGNLSDVWISCHQSQDGSTFPSWNPCERLDRIYYNDLLMPKLCKISGASDDKYLWPSDHCSIYADFDII